MTKNRISDTDWNEIISYLDVSSLLSLRLTSSSLFRLVENHDEVWQALLSHFPPSSSSFLLVNYAKDLHNFSTPTKSKQQFIARYISKQNTLIRQREKLFSIAYNHILSSGNRGLVFLSIPFIFFFFPLPLLPTYIISLFFILYGSGKMMKSVWKHATKTYEYKEATTVPILRIKLLLFLANSPYYLYLHPLSTLLVVGFASGLSLLFDTFSNLLLHTSLNKWYYSFFIMFFLKFGFFEHQFKFRLISVSSFVMITSLRIFSKTTEIRRVITLFSILFLHFLVFYTKPNWLQVKKAPIFLVTPPLPSSSLLLYIFLQCSIIPALSVSPLFYLLSQIESPSFLLVTFTILLLLVAAMATIYFSVYKLLCSGDYRWWWISYAAPACSVIVTSLFVYQALPLEKSLFILSVSSFLGSLCLSLVSRTLIGYGNNASLLEIWINRSKFISNTYSYEN